MSWVDDLNRDVRYAVRKLRKSPGFTTVAVLCLALGIGANAAIFSVVDVVLLRPLPYATPERLVRLYETVPQRDPDAREAVSWLNYQDWAQQMRGTEGLSAYVLRSRILTGAQEPERLRTVEASANLFQVLGVVPRLGRGFSPGEDVPGAAPVVILSEGAWKRL
ncbi:MAG TPA: ABC transporter permease, partial [Archangium sp.]|nr:ABC transporter permease [Archangium sp.]